MAKMTEKQTITIIIVVAILALLIASALSMAVLVVGRRQVSRKKREVALRSIIRNDDFIQSVREFGVDTSHAERKLALARNEVRMGKFDKALRLSWLELALAALATECAWIQYFS